MRIIINDAWTCIQKVKKNTPLVTMYTNIVSTAFIANSLLALGASPLVTLAEEEIHNLLKITNALVLNMGTPDTTWLQFPQNILQNMDSTIPVLFDPVGVGCSELRNDIAIAIMKSKKVAVVRANASEVVALATLLGYNPDIEKKQSGIDSMLDTTKAVASANYIAKEYSCVVMISGAIDIITDATHSVEIIGGSILMSKVTGVGCTLTAVIGAMCAVAENNFIGTIAGAVLFASIGSKLAKTITLPGTFAVAFLDTLYSCTEEDFREHAIVSALS